MIGRFTILGLILAAQTLTCIGPLGIPAIAKLIREDLGLTLAQAGSFLSAYYIGPILMSIPARATNTCGGAPLTSRAASL